MIRVADRDVPPAPGSLRRQLGYHLCVLPARLDASSEDVVLACRARRAVIEERGCDRRTAVLTSAVRDAANGAAFAEAVRERHGLEGRTLSGDQEARLQKEGARDIDALPLAARELMRKTPEHVLRAETDRGQRSKQQSRYGDPDLGCDQSKAAIEDVGQRTAG